MFNQRKENTIKLANANSFLFTLKTAGLTNNVVNAKSQGRSVQTPVMTTSGSFDALVSSSKLG